MSNNTICTENNYFEDSKLEIYSDDIQGWVELSFEKFYSLLNEEDKVADEETQINMNDLSNKGLEFKILKNTNLIDTQDKFKVGDYVEVSHFNHLHINLEFSNQDNQSCKLSVNESTDCSDGNFEYKTWKREKILSYMPSNNEYVVSNKKGTVSCVDSSRVRLLSKSNSESSSDLILKRLELEFPFEINQEQISKNLFHEVLSSYLIDNIFYSFDQHSNNNVFYILSSAMNVLYYYHLIMIKAEQITKLAKIENEISQMKGSLSKVNQVMKDQNTKIFKFHKNFRDAFTQILNNLNNEEGISNLIVSEGEEVQIILYGKENMKNFRTLLDDFKEERVAISPQISKWLTTMRKDNLNKIEEISEIVK